jgi:TolA-binding protein
MAGCALAALLLASTSVPAHAAGASKEMIELQTQVQQLLDMVQRLQSTLDGRFGVLQHLVEQTADTTNQMTATVNSLQAKINSQSEASGGKIDTVSGQVQSLNDSVDELKSRIAKLDKSVSDMQAQLQNVQSAPAGAAAPPMSQAPAGPGGGGPNNGGAGQELGEKPQAGTPQMSAAPAGSVAPPLKDTFQGGLRDYNAAHYQVASSEFEDVVHYYPQDELAGTAQFYIGEIAYRQLQFPEAIKAYNAVLEGFPGNPKAPAAQLRKGLALLQTGKRDAGIHELRQLITRHPQTPEAGSARSKLNSMGIRITG